MKFEFKYFPSTPKHSVDPLYFTMLTEYILFPFKCCTSVKDTGKNHDTTLNIQSFISIHVTFNIS